MHPNRWISVLFGLDKSVRRPIRRPAPLRVEPLETRENPNAALMPINDFITPIGNDLLVPVSLMQQPNTEVDYAVSSSIGEITATMVNRQRSLQMDVTGTDNTGQAFSGTLTLALFEDDAPLAAARIITLTERPDGPGAEGNYDGTIFHRVIDGFVIQGGDMQFGNGTGGSDLGSFPDEIRPNLTFNSQGLLAMANSGPNTNNSQFFITDSRVTPFQQPSHLNGRHTIFGILTGGFDTFERIITTPVGANDRPIDDVTIVDARIVNDLTRGVVRISPTDGFAGTGTITVTATAGAEPSTTSFGVTFANGAVELNNTPADGLIDESSLVAGELVPMTLSLLPGVTASSANVFVNGTEVSASNIVPGANGRFNVDVPASLLRVGSNNLSAIASTEDGLVTVPNSTVTFAPSLRTGYLVPGELGSTQSLEFEYTLAEARFSNELGLFIADDINGNVDGIAPGADGYAEAVFNSASRRVLFSPTDGPGTVRTLEFTAGQVIGFYLVRDATLEQLLDVNPSNALTGEIFAFFSFEAANPDGVPHVQSVSDPLRSQVLYAWEDELAEFSDFDFNDLVFVVRPEGSPRFIGDFAVVPGAPGRERTLAFELEEATRSPASGVAETTNTAPGEVGLFLVDGPDGSIGNLTPGTPGYTLTALAPDRRIVLFDPDEVSGSVNTQRLASGQLFGVYYIPNGTSEEWRASNPGNNPANSPLAFFSSPAANPDGLEHVRNVSPEQVGRDLPGAGDPVRFHLMGTFDGGPELFDDVVFSMFVDG